MLLVISKTSAAKVKIMVYYTYLPKTAAEWI
jgi:hypothetical protein